MGRMVGLRKEDITRNQKVFDFLGIGFDIKSALAADAILLPNSSQRRWRREDKDIATIVIPNGLLTRMKQIETIRRVYIRESKSFESDGIYFWGKSRENLNRTIAASRRKRLPLPHVFRPKQPYVISTKLGRPDFEVRTAFPETMGQSPESCLDMLKEKQAENPELNFTGLTLTEYLFTDVYCWRVFRHHLDSEFYYSSLLEEMVDEARCLRARWHSAFAEVRVYSLDSSYAHSPGGARSAAVSFSS